jgi:hypothetical protein
MAIERYPSADAAKANRPPDVLARRLFALGATKVTIYSSVVTVEAPADRWDALLPEETSTIEHLFLYYGDDAGWSPAALGTALAEGEAPATDPAPTESAEPAEPAPTS